MKDLVKKEREQILDRAKEADPNNRPPEARVSEINNFGIIKIRFTNDLNIEEDVVRK